MHELDRKGVRKRLARVGREHGSEGFGRSAALAQQTVGDDVGRLPLCAARGDLLCETSKILDQDDPKCDRHRPEFADGERLHLLVGSDEANQHLGVETAVGMGDEGPGDAEHAGIALKRPDRELRQLAIVSGRQVRMNLMDLLLDEMIVVDQPFRRGRDRATVVDRLDRGTIGVEQNGAVFAEPPRQKPPFGRSGRHNLRNRKTAGMALKSLDAEEFFANRFFVIPRRRQARVLKGVLQEDFQ